MNYEPIKFKSTEEREQYLREECTEYLGELAIGALIANGFLTAPASTTHHGNYAGGLFDHSANVAEILRELSDRNELVWKGGSHERSPLVVGILHDLCKIDQYKLTPEGTYVWNDEPLVKGHGIKSVIYAQIMGIRLSDEERACIIYHMGAFTEKEQWKDYNHAVRVYPNVLWTHSADMIASQMMEV